MYIRACVNGVQVTHCGCWSDYIYYIQYILLYLTYISIYQMAAWPPGEAGAECWETHAAAEALVQVRTSLSGNIIFNNIIIKQLITFFEILIKKSYLKKYQYLVMTSLSGSISDISYNFMSRLVTIIAMIFCASRMRRSDTVVRILHRYNFFSIYSLHINMLHLLFL